MAELVRRFDGFQRRHRFLGFPIAVVYKFFDDQGPYLGVILTYYSFVAIFPMLLIASSVLGFLLSGNPSLQEAVLNSALSQFPIVGDQLGRPAGMEGSASAVVVGSLAALYGVLGLGQAAQHALNTVWAVPRNSRFNPFVGRIRSFLGLAVVGLTVLAIAAISAFSSNVSAFGLNDRLWFQALVTLLSIGLTALVLSLMMRISTARRPTVRGSLPGGILIAVLWHALQLLGGVYVRHVVSKASEMNGIFALVLGLVAFLYVAAGIATFGLELNVVIDRTLWPRALLTPFTDAVELTEADRRAYVSYAKAQRHKGFERVEVAFEDLPADPETQEIAVVKPRTEHRSGAGPEAGR